MNHLRLVPRKKNSSSEAGDLAVSQEDIGFLERYLAEHHEETPVVEIAGTLQKELSTPSLSAVQDQIQSFDFFPDFSKDRSQHHYFVSPEAPPQKPLSDKTPFSSAKPYPTGRSKSQDAPSNRAPITETDSPHESPSYAGNDPSLSVVVEPSAIDQVFLPPEDRALIDSTLAQIIRSEPLLSEDELLFRLKKFSITITPQSLKQALIRNDFDTDYKRFAAYIAG